MKRQNTRAARAGTTAGLFASILAVSSLACLAFAYPILDLLGKNVEFFVIRRSEPEDVFWVTLFVVLGPASLLAFGLSLARAVGSRCLRVATAAIVGALVGVCLLRFLKLLSLGALWPLAIVLGAAAGLLYVASNQVRSFFLYLSPTLVVVPLLFLGSGNVRRFERRQGTAVELRAPQSESPVFFLVFDEWSLASILDGERQIDRLRLPNLADLAAHSTWYPRATTVSHATELAVPALLTGQLVEPEQLPRLADHPRNLFTFFGGSYDIYANEPITELCPDEINRLQQPKAPFAPRMRALWRDLRWVWLHQVVPPRFSHQLPSVSMGWKDFGGSSGASVPAVSGAAGVLGPGQRAVEFERFLAAIGPQKEDVLYFNHSLLPHMPWEYLPTGERYLTDGLRLPGLEDEVWSDDGWLIEQYWRRYLLQVEFVDQLLGSFLDKLRSLDLYDRSLIVVVADHGVSFRPGTARRRLVAENAGEILPVPLFVKGPWQREGSINEEPVRTTDVLAMVWRTLELEAPWQIDGHGDSGQLEADTGWPDEVEIRRQVSETLRRQGQLLRPATEGGWPERFDPHPELLGRSTASFKVHRGDVRARLDREPQYADVDPSHYTLSLVEGSLRAAGAAESWVGQELAVAVNGKIGGTTQAVLTPGDRLRFSTLVPPSFFRSGRNEVEVFLLHQGTSDWRLESTTSRKRTSYELALDTDGRVVGFEGDSGILPQSLEVLGYLELSLRFGETLSVSGWALDQSEEGEIVDVALFQGKRPVFTAGLNQSRQDVAEQYGKEFIDSGFRFEFDRRGMQELEGAPLRAFAVSSRGVVAELGVLFTRLEETPSGGTAVRKSDGALVPLVTGDIVGWIDGVRRDAEGLAISGWAGDLRTGRPAERVLVFYQGDLYSQLAVSFERPDVASAMKKPELIGSGFATLLPSGAEGALKDGTAILVAISARGGATRIGLVEGLWEQLPSDAL